MQCAKRVLIADDDRALVQALALRCRSLGLEVLEAHDAVSALAIVKLDAPDLVCLDVNMPAGNGLSVCECLASEPRWARIPVIIMTGRKDATTVRRCHDLCAYYVLKADNLWERMEPLIHELVDVRRVSPSQTAMSDEDSTSVEPHNAIATLLCVDDDFEFIDALALRLSAYNIRVIAAHNGMEGFRMALQHRPDVIITDLSMPDGEGDYLLRRLRDHTLTAKTPVMVASNHSGGHLKRKMTNLGAAAYFTKPVAVADLMAELRRCLPALSGPGNDPLRRNTGARVATGSP